ncbi:MAG: ABC transporter ATP-binding protein [Chloroflexota bacterium]
MAGVRVRDLVVEFAGGTRALDGLSLTINDGEFFALLGPSGCGKTTLLRTIAGLISPRSGVVEIGQADVTRLSPGARNVAMVFQDYALYPHMTVLENIAYPLKIRRVAKGQRQETAQSTAGHLGLSHLLERRPAQLSGGQQQRAALARAVASRPHVFLLDEPLSNLDARLRLEARTFLRRLQRELATTTIYVTHDQSEALAMADRMAVMEAGIIRQVGTPVEVFREPASLFVAQFTGSTPMNLLSATVDGADLRVSGHRLAVPERRRQHLRTGDDVTVGIRPEYMSYSPTPQPNGLPGSVMVAEHLGVSSLITMESQDLIVRVVVPEDQAPPLGEQGWAVADPRHLLVYDADGFLLPRAGDTADRPQAAPTLSAGEGNRTRSGEVPA